MSAKKLARIRALCEADPGNPFGWYSLAIEQKKTDAAAALEIFARVHSEHADYLPNYYHYGQTLADDGEVDQAKAVLEQGIAVATKAGDAHTLGELRDALDLL